MHLDVQLSLWRYFVEASAAGIALHVNDAEAVACVLAYALERSQESGLNLCFELCNLFLQFLFLGASLFHNLVQLAFLHLKVVLALLYGCLVLVQLVGLLLYACLSLANLLVAQLYLECLELDFLAQCVVFTVVLYVVELCLVSVNAGLCLVYFCFFLAYGFSELVYFMLNLFDAYGQALNLVLKVLNFQGQFTPQRLFLVYSRECGLQLVECLQLFLN